ncbi:GNAT family N-acetyltransferase, partial [Streptomyces virginiae]|uniref:GNAT family N-acetyltransferase n=1 Tax=Streptomyces virginiae TaxID=1961 RepID=UPI0036A91166
MTLTFTLDPVVGPSLRDGILELWTDVSNAGGAVGFVPPVTRDDVRPSLDKHLAAVADGSCRLLVGHDEDGAVAATAFLTHNTHRLQRHWLWAYTVMVHPRHQGKGLGRDLMAASAGPPPAPRGVAPHPRPGPGGPRQEDQDTHCGD